jgi:hypothetical protein
MLSIFSITIFLSSTVPLISVAAFFYLCCRHVTDSVNLLTVFRKEIDSSGRLIETATNAALWFVMVFQVFMMAFFVLTDQLNEAMACVLILVVSTLYIVASYEKVYGLLIHDEEASVNEVTVNRGSIRIMDNKKRDLMIRKWRADYDHPLALSNVRRRADTMGLEIKNIDNWHEYMKDSTVRDLLVPNKKGIFPSRESGMFHLSKELSGFGKNTS